MKLNIQQVYQFTNLSSKSHLRCLPPRQVYFIDYPYCFRMDKNGKCQRVFFDCESQFTKEEVSLLSSLKQSLSKVSSQDFMAILERSGNSFLLRILHYFNFNLLKTKMFFEQEFLELLAVYNHSIVLNPSNFAHEQIIKILTSGFLYCTGRDKKYRPNLIFDLNKLDSTSINKVGLSKFIIDLSYFQAYDLLNSLIYLVEYAINFVLYPGKIEQINIILFLSSQHVLRFNEIRKGNFSFGDIESLGFDRIVTEFCLILGKLKPFRVHRIFFVTDKLANASLNLPFGELEKVAQHLRIPITEFHVGALDELNCVLYRYIQKSQLEVKLEGSQPNLSKGNLFPPVMYIFEIENNCESNASPQIISSEGFSKHQLKSMEKTNHINNYSVLKKGNAEKGNLREKERGIRKNQNFKTYDTTIKLDSNYCQCSSSAPKKKNCKGIIVNQNAETRDTQNHTSNPSAKFRTNSKPSSKEFENYFNQSSEASPDLRLHNQNYESCIMNSAFSLKNYCLQHDSLHKMLGPPIEGENLFANRKTDNENIKCAYDASKETASLIDNNPVLNCAAKAKSKFYVDPATKLNSNQLQIHIKEEGRVENCCQVSTGKCINQSNGCILY